MYCIDTEALVFMFNGGTIHPNVPASLLSGTLDVSMQYILKLETFSF